ncbi:MAG: transposase [Chitinophagaceae bacterium]|nr:transposase [Chitinophagaceae bacterium]
MSQRIGMLVGPNELSNKTMIDKIFMRPRKSYIEPGQLNFWTATINGWRHLMKHDAHKDIIIESLDYLSRNQLAAIYAFVIMPNHLHMIWRTLAMNGKETAQGSFLKYTAHRLLNMLRAEGLQHAFRVDAINKKHEIWQRDSLAVPIYTRAVAMQKLNYLHFNPLAPHWLLAEDPCDYKYSSALYYEKDIKNFSFLQDLWEVI